MIVWIASYPRSGNTLFRLLLRFRYGIATYSVFDDPLFESNGIASLIGQAPLCGEIDELALRPELFFIKTHRLEDAQTDHPAVYIVRDGRDALISCAYYELSYGDVPIRRFLTDCAPERLRRCIFRHMLRKMILDNRFGGWSKNVNAWRNRDADTTVIRFEDLVRNPVNTVSGALSQLGLETRPTDISMPSFADLHDRWPNFFRRGESEALRQEMDADVESLFWRRHKHAMQTLGYR